MNEKPYITKNQNLDIAIKFSIFFAPFAPSVPFASLTPLPPKLA